LSSRSSPGTSAVWTQALCLEGELAICEPKTLRYLPLHTAGRLAFHARRAILRLPASWPWASELAAAFARLQALSHPPADRELTPPRTTPAGAQRPLIASAKRLPDRLCRAPAPTSMPRHGRAARTQLLPPSKSAPPLTYPPLMHDRG